MRHFCAVLFTATLCAIFAANLTAQVTKVHSGFFETSDGVRLHYLESGSGPAIVLVPGWSMPAWIWEPQIDYFAKSYHVVALDPRSQGESEKANHGNYPDRRAQDIKELMDTLKVGPAILVGWSQGVPEVLTYAEKFGGTGVRGYVLVDGFVWEKQTLPFVSSMLGMYSKVEGNRRDFTEAFVRSMYRKPQSDDYIQRVVEATLQTPADSAVAMSVTALARPDWTPAISKLDRPVLVTCETALKPMVADPIVAVLPHTRVETFPNAGHALFVDDAPQFNAILDDFIRHLPLTAPPLH